jgi:hypothetical protein
MQKRAWHSSGLTVIELLKLDFPTAVLVELVQELFEVFLLHWHV